MDTGQAACRQLADDRTRQDDDGIDRAADDAAQRHHGECLHADLAHCLDLVGKERVVVIVVAVLI